MRILVAEDDEDTSRFIKRGLSELGHNPVMTGSGTDALHLLLTEQFDAAIVDRMLPGLDGVAVVRRTRSAKIQTPVLILTALGRIQDRVDGLDAGADDYLVKPFAFSEVAARLNALARRKTGQLQRRVLEYKGIVVDLMSRQVHRDGRPVMLQPREYQILEELMREAGKVLTRTMLLERVWDFHFEPQTNIVDTHISRLRSKLNQGGKPDAIETVRSAGYRMASYP